MAKNAKYYVVWVGRKPGIYTSWSDCKAQVHGVAGAKYKAFKTRAEAELAFRNSVKVDPSGSPKTRAFRRAPRQPRTDGIISSSISVDAACSGNPGVMEYRGVQTADGEVLFHKGPFPLGTNNIGEFLAIVHALAMLHKAQDGSTPIYSDSVTAIGWVKAGKARTKLVRNQDSEVLHRLIERAEHWLKTHSWPNPLIKWDTARWGEIPADFGRKS
jgi:ribonuclease HI